MHFGKITAVLITAVSLGMVVAAPLLTLDFVSCVSFAKPHQVLYEKRVSASGTIESTRTNQIYLETPVLADEVSVHVGDQVKKGQVLAVIDIERTRQILQSKGNNETIAASTTLESAGLSVQDTQNLASLYQLMQQAGLEPFGKELSDFAISQTGTPNIDTQAYIPSAISSPMDGIVTQIGVQSDILFSSSQPALTISDNQNFIAKVAVGESNVGQIQEGDKAVITGSGFPDKTYTGHVSKIYPTARKLSGSISGETVVDVEIAIDEPDSDLKAGFTVVAEIVTSQQKEMLAVPYEAISQDDNNQEYVYIIENSAAVRRNIETGLELSDGVEVLNGLDGSELIIANVSENIREGEPLLLEGGETLHG